MTTSSNQICTAERFIHGAVGLFYVGITALGLYCARRDYNDITREIRTLRQNDSARKWLYVAKACLLVGGAGVAAATLVTGGLAGKEVISGTRLSSAWKVIALKSSCVSSGSAALLLLGVIIHWYFGKPRNNNEA